MKRHVRRLAAVAAVTVGLPLLIAGPAAAHVSGYDSVHSNKIDYIDDTIYDDARGWARDRWNAAGDVDIRLDTGWTDANLAFIDIAQPAESWAAMFTFDSNGEDMIFFNTTYMSGYSTAQRRHVALHGLGHALGLSHSWTGQVMQSSVGSIEYLQSHDQSSYDSLWG